nr:MAG TPA: hypothetical protein [Caudoviricetes sp.]
MRKKKPVRDIGKDVLYRLCCYTESMNSNFRY